MIGVGGVEAFATTYHRRSDAFPYPADPVVLRHHGVRHAVLQVGDILLGLDDLSDRSSSKDTLLVDDPNLMGDLLLKILDLLDRRVPAIGVADLAEVVVVGQELPGSDAYHSVGHLRHLPSQRDDGSLLHLGAPLDQLVELARDEHAERLHDQRLVARRDNRCEAVAQRFEEELLAAHNPSQALLHRPH